MSSVKKCVGDRNFPLARSKKTKGHVNATFDGLHTNFAMETLLRL